MLSSIYSTMHNPYIRLPIASGLVACALSIPLCHLFKWALPPSVTCIRQPQLITITSQRNASQKIEEIVEVRSTKSRPHQDFRMCAILGSYCISGLSILASSYFILKDWARFDKNPEFAAALLMSCAMLGSAIYPLLYRASPPSPVRSSYPDNVLVLTNLLYRSNRYADIRRTVLDLRQFIGNRKLSHPTFKSDLIKRAHNLASQLDTLKQKFGPLDQLDSDDQTLVQSIQQLLQRIEKYSLLPSNTPITTHNTRLSQISQDALKLSQNLILQANFEITSADDCRKINILIQNGDVNKSQFDCAVKYLSDKYVGSKLPEPQSRRTVSLNRLWKNHFEQKSDLDLPSQLPQPLLIDTHTPNLDKSKHLLLHTFSYANKN